MSELKRLIDLYDTGKADWKASIDLAQLLLDTDLIEEFPQYEQLCEYYLTEGLCYYVPV